MCQSEDCIIFQPFSIYPSFSPFSFSFPCLSLLLSPSLSVCRSSLLLSLPHEPLGINGFPYGLNENNKHLTFILNVSASNGDIESDSFEIWVMGDVIKRLMAWKQSVLSAEIGGAFLGQNYISTI